MEIKFTLRLGIAAIQPRTNSSNFQRTIAAVFEAVTFYWRRSDSLKDCTVDETETQIISIGFRLVKTVAREILVACLKQSSFLQEFTLEGSLQAALEVLGSLL